MDTLVKQGWVKDVELEEVFPEKETLLLTALDSKLPVKFNASIYAVKTQYIGLNLPEAWWNIVSFEKGMSVKMTRMHRGGMYTLLGEIVQVEHAKVPSIEIRHAGHLVRNQRRLFYRVQLKKPFLIKKAHVPEGLDQKNIPAILSDISAGGIGFTLDCFFSPGTTFNTVDLIQTVLPELEERKFTLEVVWCKVGRPFGYRLGARFLYDGEREQDDMVKVINQLQLIRMSKYCHIVGNE